MRKATAGVTNKKSGSKVVYESACKGRAMRIIPVNNIGGGNKALPATCSVPHTHTKGETHRQTTCHYYLCLNLDTL